MAKIEFEDLVLLYSRSTFGQGGAEDESIVIVNDPKIVDLLTRVENEEYAVIETGVTLLDDLSKVQLGAEVRVRLEAPRAGFGVLARGVDSLIRSPNGRRKEPRHFYLINPRFGPDDPNPPEILKRYRKVLAIVELLSKAATLIDETRSELIFVKEGRIDVPIQFDSTDLGALDVDEADRLLNQFGDELHNEQKLAILFETVVELCRGQSSNGRFKILLHSLKEVTDKVAAGYKLFASSFSYTKIKGELEDARISYTQKIHKTIVDIQNQLLGIPVATVVVASQMKAPTVCGPENWVNFAVLVGAWLFIILLLVAIVNQWLTLNVTKDEISQQKKKLQKDFKAISDDFVKTFDSLQWRIFWHHISLSIIAAIGIFGAVVATHFYNRISALPPLPCATSAAKTNVARLAPRVGTSKPPPTTKKATAVPTGIPPR